ncbi:flagellar hook-basal body complex protein FliE [Acetobacterium paludosum]|uniref:Flagellar hook-basal body complex protein FliE n=2 Tax=Acetobacterium paludosum TaxID=52693 RepID=A0A923HV56_9FIRM|nr:flagellar hook-basal body complex protein FliE [Acetobacterium paludosum]
MVNMFIVPMDSIIGGSSSISSISNSLGGASATTETTGSTNSFKDTLQGMMDNVEQTEAQTKVDAYNLSIGNMDDPSTMMINSAKADVALQTMVQLRNKALDAYSAVMSTSL